MKSLQHIVRHVRGGLLRGVCGGFHVTESPTEVALRNGPDEPVPPTVTVTD